MVTASIPSLPSISTKPDNFIQSQLVDLYFDVLTVSDRARLQEISSFRALPAVKELKTQ
jgi:hypothetical protein